MKLFVGMGADDRLRPGDLVGAIANETSLSGSDIGHIRIGNKFSVVEVPAKAEREVTEALGRTTIRGRRPNVRRFREE